MLVRQKVGNAVRYRIQVIATGASKRALDQFLRAVLDHFANLEAIPAERAKSDV
jgi:hypothetical protein